MRRPAMMKPPVVLTDDEYKRLVKMCSIIATDQHVMFAAIEGMLRRVNSTDRETLKVRLRLNEIGITDSRCYTLPNGECISPFACMHGDGLPLSEFVQRIIKSCS